MWVKDVIDCVADMVDAINMRGAKMRNSYILKSPIGLLKISEENGQLIELGIQEKSSPFTEYCSQQGNTDIVLVQENKPHSDLLSEACKQLNEYFAGKRMQFDLPVAFTGTSFQQQVWKELQKIPYGETRSYADIAAAIGNPKAVRAIGQANHRNPIMIVVPCHRVINKNGSLGGFGGGLEVKKYLLDLEKEAPHGKI